MQHRTKVNSHAADSLVPGDADEPQGQHKVFRLAAAQRNARPALEVATTSETRTQTFDLEMDWKADRAVAPRHP